MSGSKIDILLYKVPHVQIFLIPAPDAGTSYDIRHWDLQGNPLWEGELEMREIEHIEDYLEANPFKGSEKTADPKDLFQLELTLVSQNVTFARVPSVYGGPHDGIIATDSTKLYAIFPEIPENVDLEIDSQTQVDELLHRAGGTMVKRIGLGLKFPSSFEASNFSMYLSQFRKDFEVYSENFLENSQELEAKKDPEVKDLDEKFYEIQVSDTPLEKSGHSKFDSESDESDDDFGDFTEV